MVNNHCIVLDEGIEKNIKEVIVDMFDEDIRARWYKVSTDVFKVCGDISNNIRNYDLLVKPDLHRYKKTYGACKYEKDMNEYHSERSRLHAERQELLQQLARLDPDDWIADRPHWSDANIMEKTKQYDYAHKYFNIEKFIPFICINVSPNWKKIGHSGS